jgi:glucokinase
MADEHVVGVDLGGTKILAGVVGADGRIRGTVERPTPTTSEEALLDALEAAVRELISADTLAVGFGVPARVDSRSGIVLGAVNVPLHDLVLGAEMGRRLGLPVGVENDASAAALAEFTHGAGRGARDMVMLTLGTGVGGGVVIDDKLYRGWAELGHVVVVAGGQPCQGNCHGHGHLEAHASGLAADRAAAAIYGPGTTAPLLLERARAGDERAIDALAEIGRLLGAAIGSLVNIFDPDVVIIGGGFGAAAGDLVLEPARAAARAEAIQPADTTLRIVEAELGDEAGLIGAGLVAFEALDGVR